MTSCASVTITGAGIVTEMFQVMVYRFRMNNRRQVKVNETNGVTLAMQRECTVPQLFAASLGSGMKGTSFRHCSRTF